MMCLIAVLEDENKMKAKKKVVIALAAILISCGVIGGVYMWQNSGEPMELKIVSFNIRAHDDGVVNSIMERAPRLASVIEPYEPDIMGFQEFSPMWEKHIEEYYSDTYDMFNKYRSETSDMESCPILWRKDKFKCIDTGYFWLSDTPEEESKGWDEKYDCYRICEYVILKAKETNTKFVVMNTHFGFGDEGQVKSVELLHEYSKKISNYPTIVLGDFNMTPNTPAYERMTELFTDVNAVTTKDWSQTYHGYNPELNAEKHIDYCFVDQKVVPLGQEIIDTLIKEKYYSSDHYGLYTTVRLGE